jgi:hypothetical protein
MKIFASFLLTIISLSLCAQHEFAPIGAEWYYNKMLSYNPPEAGYVKLTSIKDSIIENKDVRVIEVLFSPDDTTQIMEGYEYIHQSGDTIWYWKNNQFHTLYNFDMQKGDSILLYSEMLNQCSENDPYAWNRVDSVFTRTFNGIRLKAYTSTPLNNSVWGFEDYSCEIFGNLKYLIPQNKDCVNDGIWYGPLRCYSDPINGILITSLPSVKCDSTYTYTGPISVSFLKRTGKLSIYPNPTSCEITVDGYDFNDQSYEIKIINIKGNVVKVYYSDIYIIDVSDLINGIYFLTISINKKTIDYEKFIKI